MPTLTLPHYTRRFYATGNDPPPPATTFHSSIFHATSEYDYALESLESRLPNQTNLTDLVDRTRYTDVNFIFDQV
ncbi:MAG: hypothetical protein ACRYE7_02345 [Janthinobacterium lividum]